MNNENQWDEMMNLASTYQRSYLEEESTSQNDSLHSQNYCGYKKNSAFYQPNKM
jgi:hypothetical protein